MRDAAHLFACAAPALSFALLWRRRAASLITLYMMQAAALAAASFCQGVARDAAGLYAVALVAIAANVVLMPTALRRAALPDAEAASAPVVALGVVLVALAMLVAPQGTPDLPAREDLAWALAMVLLGLLTMLSRRAVMAQATGLLSVQLGVAFAAIAVPDLPMLIVLAVAMLALPAGVVFLARSAAP